MKKPTPAAKARTSPAPKKSAGKAATKGRVKVDAEAEAEEEEDVKPVAKAATKAATASGRESLSKRLPEMTDYQLRAYHMSTARISRDTAHPKSAGALADLPLIEKEINRRATSPGVLPTPGRVGVARPKSDIAKGGKGRG